MIEGLKPYPEYKESGLPWLGRCPKHWSVRRTKILFHERVQKGFPNEPLLAATQTKGVVKKEDYETRTVTAQKDLHLLKLVEVGDYVISLRSFQGGIEVAHCRGIISPAYTVLKPRKTAISGYYSHFFKAKPFIDSLSLFVTGIREGQNIDYERLSRAEMPMPPEDEQTAIVRFLDHANRKIDGFIRAKRKLIGLLNEQKQAIIHRAVTGKDEVRRMKDENGNSSFILQPSTLPKKPSGNVWLGDIPSHWEARAFARMSRVVRGSSPRPAGDKRFFNGDFMPWVTVGEVTKDGEIYLKSTATFLTQMGAERSTMFPAGTLVLTNSGATLGVPKILDIDACANDGIVAFLGLRSLMQKPFAYLFLSTLTQRLRDEMRQGGTQPNLNTGIVRRIVCPIPPIEEQEAILKYVERESEPLNTAIARTEREIALMQEYRTRLTADVVTGKLDVREAAAKLPEPPAEPAAAALDETEDLDEAPAED